MYRWLMILTVMLNGYGCLAAQTTRGDTKDAACPAVDTSASQPSDKTDDQEGKDDLKLIEDASITEHELIIDGQPLPYRATAGYLQMKTEENELKASIFFVAYEKLAPTAATGGDNSESQAANGEAESSDETIASQQPAERAITFVFNGGPGAAAVWLHVGTAGPKCIKLDPKGFAPAPPYELIDNPDTWLTDTDLVFIDPVGTGFSRPAKGEKGEQFYGVREDIEWVADFIRLYTTLYERWASPKFLAGESYGTTRAAGLSQYLLDRFGIALNGIVFISTVLDFQTLAIHDDKQNDLAYVLFLPACTAAAWYHQRLEPDLQDDLSATLAEVEEWAGGEYARALFEGSALSKKKQADVARRLSRYLALPVDFIERNNLRVSPFEFRQKLLLDQQQVIGRFDSRVTGFNPRPNDLWPPFDPSASQYIPVYTAAFNDYVRRTLEFKSPLPYEVLSRRVWPWKWEEDGRSGYLSMADDLRSAMIENPHLKAMFASGYYDLATPYFATNYTIAHLHLSERLRANIEHHYYTGGHMMYHNPADRTKLHRDISTFIRSAVSK